MTYRRLGVRGEQRDAWHVFPTQLALRSLKHSPTFQMKKEKSLPVGARSKLMSAGGQLEA